MGQQRDYSCDNCHFSFSIKDTIFILSDYEFEEMEYGFIASDLISNADIYGDVVLYWCFDCNKFVKKYIIKNSNYDLNKTIMILNKYLNKNSVLVENKNEKIICPYCDSSNILTSDNIKECPKCGSEVSQSPYVIMFD